MATSASESPLGWTNKDVHLVCAPALVLDVWFSKYFSLFSRHLTFFVTNIVQRIFGAVVAIFSPETGHWVRR